jgi:Fe-S-cluster-containing dehydrogenase component
MKKWNMVIDVAKCFNCNCCTLACHDEYHGNEFPGYAAEIPKHGQRWIDIRQRETGQVPMVEVSYLPVMCNHCDNPPCLKAAKNGAVVKRPDGIVIIVPEKARGQKQIVDACPYGAAFWNEEKQLPQAWPFDAHLLDQGWTRTRGSQLCPTQAMRTVHATDAEMQEIVEREGLEVLAPEHGTRPRVYYRNLSRFVSVFVGGSLIQKMAGVIECAPGVQVTLMQNGKAIDQQTSDTFGDFRFRDLKPNSGNYQLRIQEQQRTLDVELKKQSVYLGAIELTPSPSPATATH